jgi:hypothetical protein
MKVLRTSVPIFTHDLEAAIERYEALTRETVRERFEVPEQGIEIAILGSLTIIAGPEHYIGALRTSARRSSSTRLPSTPHICARRAQRRFRGQIRRQPAQT